QERERAVVVLDDVRQRGEAAVVVEAALLVCPQARQRRGAVAMVGIARGLEVVDADLRGGVRVPAGLRVERRGAGGGAAGLAREELAAASRRARIEAAGRRARGGDGELVEVQGRQLRGDQIGLVLDVGETRGRGDRELRGVVQASVDERSLAVHLEIRDE